MMLITISRARSFFLAIFASGLFISGCASAPPAPTSALDAAQVALVNAERSDAGRFAAAELAAAREKLAQADMAVREGRMKQAERLALEARMDAELAHGKTEAEKAAAINEEMQRDSDALTEEMDRTGGQP